MIINNSLIELIIICSTAPLNTYTPLYILATVYMYIIIILHI
jgi:hypothetical protein